MAKRGSGQPSEITRRDAIKRVFDQQGRLNIEELISRLSPILDYDLKEMQRTVYEDLKKLVNSGYLNQEVDGQTVSDFDGKKPVRGKSKTWALRNLPQSMISGADLLGPLGVTIRPSHLLKSFLDVAPSLEGSQTHRQLAFNLTDKLFTLRMDEQGFPLRIFISRKGDTSSEKVKSKVDQFTGFSSKSILQNRTILMEFPVQTISGFKDEGHLGHFAIEFTGANVEVIDLHSKNGTFYHQFERSFLEKAVLELTRKKGKTLTADWLPKELTAFQKLDPGCPTKVELPVVLQASSAFKVLLF